MNGGPPARHSVSVVGVIPDGRGRALLVRRRDNRHWEPPGGVLELDEPIEAGLRREVWEETGLVVEPVTLTGVYKNMTRGVIALAFRCRVLAGQLATNDEVSGFCWATPEEVRVRADEAFAVRVLDALSDSPVPADQARVSLGIRLRDLRRDAGLSGIELAQHAGWLSSKVSKIEHGKQTPSEEDLQTWCRQCGTLDQLPDLVAAVRSIETQFAEQIRANF